MTKLAQEKLKDMMVRSFTSIQMVHTHTPPQWGIFLHSPKVGFERKIAEQRTGQITQSKCQRKSAMEIKGHLQIPEEAPLHVP